MFILYKMAFAPAQKPYRIGLLFTHKNRDFGAISATAGSCVAPRRSLRWRVTYRIGSHYINKLFMSSRKPYRIGLLLTHMNGDFGAISATAGSCAAPRRSLERRVTYRIGVHTMSDSYSCRHESHTEYRVSVYT